MASSSSASPADSPSRSRPTSIQQEYQDHNQDAPSPEFNPDDVSVEVLVKHLLAAKQSLSSIGLVLHANNLATHARRMHEESVILSAQTGFLREGIADQFNILSKLRRSMGRVYAGGQRDFKKIVRTLDAADGRLSHTIQMLRETTVESVFRPSDEQPKNLMDFVDENSVGVMRNALKESIRELQVSPLAGIPNTRYVR